MEIPSNVIAIARDAAEKHGDDIRAAVVEAEQRIRKLAEFADFENALITNAIQEMVYDARHRWSGQLKKSSGGYNTTQNVIPGKTESFAAVTRSLYTYCIGGQMLGSVLGASLTKIASSESAVAAGHVFNARLCRRLAGMVPEDKTVKQVVSERKLKAIFAELQEPVKTAAKPDSKPRTTKQKATA
jgi:hypothetical protein